jgi:starch synthase
MEFWGRINLLKGGIVHAHKLVTVSPTYAREIQTPEFGCGLDGLLQHRRFDLTGILNGIDTDVWNPASDELLAATYDARDLSGRAANRAAVLDAVELPDGPGPLVVMVTRLVEQKGVDLVLPLVEFLAELPVELAVLGSGEAALAAGLHSAAAEHPDTVAFVEGYDEALSHRLFAGGDLLLMPSRFEPCGLAQMQALRYGTLPVVTAVGGLRDTVIDIDRHPTTGTGWAAARPDSLSLLDALHRAVRGWSDPEVRLAAQARGMAVDWSWREPAARHLELYEQVRGR